MDDMGLYGQNCRHSNGICIDLEIAWGIEVWTKPTGIQCGAP